MKILINYFIDKYKSKILEFDVNEEASFADVTQYISKCLDCNVLLIPVKIKDTKNGETVLEYCQKIQGSSFTFHFNGLRRDSLSEEEKAILMGLSTDSSVFTEKNQASNNLRYPQELIQFLGQVLPEDIQQALVVRFTNKTNMFGQTYQDTITASVKNYESRYSVQVHPYPWLAAGASNVIVYKNFFNEIFVALVYNQRRDKRLTIDPLKQAGVPDFWKLPEGYMHPKPCKGGENGISLVSSDDMDEAEELMLKNVSMDEAYKAIKAKKSNASETETPQSYSSYDSSTKECAIRESYEEVGYKASMGEVQFVSQREENRLIPTIVNVYLVKPKRRDIAPPVLKVDGVEIKDAIWGKLHAFYFEKDNTKLENIRVVLDYYDKEGHCYAVEVPIKYALMIGQAMKKFRDEEIQISSQFEGYSLFASRENVEARVKQILNTASLNKQRRTLQDILGISPENYLQDQGICNLPGDSTQEQNNNLKALANLGKKANSYHKKIIALAASFKHASLDRPLNADQLATIVKEVPIIESNLFRSKATLFPLARLHPVVQTEEKLDEVKIFN